MVYGAHVGFEWVGNAVGLTNLLLYCMTSKYQLRKSAIEKDNL